MHIIQGEDEWFPLDSGHDDADQGGHKAGEVRLVVEAYDFSKVPAHIHSPLKRRGAANSVALLNIELRCMRGLPREHAAGVKVKIKIGRQGFESNPSVFEEAMQDFTYDTKI